MYLSILKVTRVNMVSESTESFDIIKSYIDDEPHFVVKHHLDSYNDFMFGRIPNTIKSMNPFRVLKTNDNTVIDIKVYMGGVSGKGIYLDKPIMNYNSKPHVMLPNEARLRNLSYVTNLYVDIDVVYQTNKNDNEPDVIKKTFQRVFIGAIPIMMHSKLCTLRGLDEGNLIEMGECPYDQGGYFIIDGKEKVIIAQERGATNKVFINKSSSPEYIYEGYIRCTSEEDALFPKTLRLFMLSKDIASGKRLNSITLTVPHISTQIPLCVMFRALGIESDKDIINHIIPNSENDLSIANLLYSSIIDCPGIYTQEHALEYLKEFTEYKTVEHVRYILIFNMLPNVGHEYHSKAMYLGHIVNKLLSTHLDRLDETDRDNYMYKRVHLSGFMLSDIFRDFYNSLRRHVRNTIDREYEKGPWQKAGNIHDIVNLVNMDTIFSSSFITEGMLKSMKGNWGMMDDPSKAGIVQDLSRISYVGCVSHLRRVNTPIDRSIKILSPHRLNTSQYGFMCPVESPDGASVGLIKNIAMMTHITFDTPPGAIYDAMNSMGDGFCIWLDDMTLNDITDKSVKLFVNNAWVALVFQPEKVVRYLKMLKRNALISVFTSISWDVRAHVLSVLSEAGRCCRPMFIVNPDKTLRIKGAKYEEWSDLFRGTLVSRDKFDFYNKMFANPFEVTGINDIDELLTKLESTSAIMEFIDVEETNTSMIAMTQNDVVRNALVGYTHVEIHPSTMFSIYTATIPLSNHNQAPRNIFSGAQGKQAVGVFATNFNNRLDTMTYILHYPQKPLVTTMFNDMFHCNKLPSGENLIVAISCYTGYNQEDSIMINKSSVERGMFNMTYFKTVVDSESSNKGQKIIFTHPVAVASKGKHCKIKGFANYTKINEETGLPIINSRIEEGDVFLGKCKVSTKDDKNNDIFKDANTEVYTDTSLKADKTVSGFVDKIFVSQNKMNENNVKIRFRKWRKPELGDKCASRHGQKGVVGMLLPAEQMPFTKDGLIPDMIINPHAFPSRMTIAHLLECVISKVCCLDGFEYDATPFENHDFESIFSRLKSHGLECHGNEIMYNGMTGDQIESSIFIGPTYYQRLKHMVADKINYRLSGPVTSITRQPTKGRANDGGLRIGTMETDVLVSNGMVGFLKESLMERADGCTFMIDADNGNITSSTKGVSNIDKINVPYAIKALMYEVNTLGINPILIT